MQEVYKVPVVQQVVENLQEYILSGEVKVGDKLPTENELCKRLSVGRSTIREAFRILQANGFVEIKPGRGAFVRRTEEPVQVDVIEWFAQNEVELIDCIQVRYAIEPLAIKLAISNCTDEDIAKLKTIHEEFVKAVEGSDAAAIAHFDELFHTQIMEMSHNNLLISINKLISDGVKSFRDKTFMVPRNAMNAIDPHSSILSAIQAKDTEAGEMYMKRHINKILEDLTVIIKK